MKQKKWLSKNIGRLAIVGGLVCWLAAANGQQSTLVRSHIDFYDGNALRLAQAGGLNTPQFNEADLNGDGLQDLVVFDRRGEVVLPFLQVNGQYEFAPMYAAHFPDVRGFVIMRDYNCDGVADLFTYPTDPVPGFEVHRGYYAPDGKMAFQKVTFPADLFDILFYNTQSNVRLNIYTPRDDYAAIDDLDSDGDLDILGFDILGGYVLYYENQSQDLGYGCDSLLFREASNCWGRFLESGLSNVVSLSPTQDSCVGKKIFVGAGRHSGSTLLTLDLDNDGDKEIILGDVSFENLIMLTNGGSQDTAWMVAQDTAFPSYDVAAQVPIFPAAFYMDVDFDGKKDLLCSPSAYGNASESKRVVWRYRNVQSNAFPQFDWQEEDWLVGEMLDFGTGASPTYADYNADGLLDLVVGNFGYFDPLAGFTAQLALFENIGTAQKPKFSLVNADYLNLRALHLRDLHPTFGDLDGDGDLDLLVGEEGGGLVLLENTAGNGKPFAFGQPVLNYQSIDVGIAATPQLYDLNADGRLDLAIGSKSGVLSFYLNTGTAGAPAFALQTPNTSNGAFGNVDVRAIGYSTGYSAPFFAKANGSVTRLYVGSLSGNIFQYSGIDNNLNGNFNLVSDQFAALYEGINSKIDIRDLNADGILDYTVGNIRGGLAIFSETDIVSATREATASAVGFEVFPNPTSGAVTVMLSPDVVADWSVAVFNSVGVLVVSEAARGSQNSATLSLAHVPNGVYWVKVTAANGATGAKKVVVLR